MITLKKLDYSHLEIIRQWRNENRHYFLNESEISKETHFEWYKKYLEDIQSVVYIVFVNHVPIGNLKVSWAGNHVWFDNVVLGDKRYEGKGYMKFAFEVLMGAFPAKEYALEVKNDNKKAINFYKKLGFKIDQKRKTTYYMTRGEYDDTTA